MLKIITNTIDSTATLKISFDVKAIRNCGGYYDFYDPTIDGSGNPSFYLLSEDRYLFLKISYSGITSSDHIVKTILRLFARSVQTTTVIKLYHIPSIESFSSMTGDNLYDAFTDTSTHLVDQIVLEDDTSVGRDGERPFELDLSNITDLIDSDNTDLFIAITCDASLSSFLSIYHPSASIFSGKSINSVSLSYKGLNAINRYGECSCSSLDKGYINLYTGELVHLFNTFQTANSKQPITPTLAYNSNGGSSFSNSTLPCGLRINTDYTISLSNGIYSITDFTRKSRAYFYVNRSDTSIDLADFGIKHLDNQGDIYYCYEDCSYIFVDSTTSSSYQTITYYDKDGNYMVFRKYSSRTELRCVGNKFGEEITTTWKTYSLIKYHITNLAGSRGGSVGYNYMPTSQSVLSNLLFTNENRVVFFSYSSDVFSISLYDTNNMTASLKKLEVAFNDNKIVTITEKNASNETIRYLTYTYSSDKVSNVSIYDYSDNLISSTDYIYENSYTKTVDYEGNELYYYFDRYGRVRTIVDNKGRTQTFNYDEIIDGTPKGVTSKSNVQPSSRNLLDNHSFEYLDNNNELLSWTRIGTQSYVLSKDSVYGGHSLHINATNSLTLFQDVDGLIPGEYKLKIKAKAPNINNLIVRATLEYCLLSITPTGGFPPFVTEEVPYSVDFDINSISSSLNWESYETNSINILSTMIRPKIIVKIISSGTNEVFLDDFQLSNKDQIIRYNLIENGYLEKKTSNNLPSSWVCSNLRSGDQIESFSINSELSKVFGRSVMYLTSCDIGAASGSFPVRELKKEIDISGSKNDEFSFSVWAKCLSTFNTKFQAFITFDYVLLGEKTYYFDFEKGLSTWQLLSRSVLTEDNYTSIVVGVIYDGADKAYFDAFQLCKDSYGEYYNYDRWGNLVESISSNGNSMRIVLEDGEPKSVVLQDGSHYKYDYDSDGRLSTITDINGNISTFTYDNRGNVISSSTQIGNDTITNTFTYDNNDNQTSKTDEFDNSTTMTYDSLARLTSVTNANGFVERFSYDALSKLLTVSGFNNANNQNPNYKNEMSHHSRLEIVSSVASLNGSVYSFTYDAAGRLLNIKNGTNIIQSFTYNEYSSSINRNLVSTKTYGDNGDVFSFIYDDEDRLISVSLNSNTLYQYEYNEYSRLSSTKDIPNGIIKYYSYDLNGHLIKVKTNSSSFCYEYDSLGNIQRKSFFSIDHDFDEKHDHDYEFNKYTKEGFLSRLGNNYYDEIVVSDYKGAGEYGLRPSFINVDYSYDSTLKSNLFSFTNSNQYILYPLNRANSNRSSGVVNGVPFNKTTWAFSFAKRKSIYMFFKPTRSSSGEVNLLKLTRSLGLFPFIHNPVISINIDSSNHIKLVDESGATVITTIGTVNMGEWNFLCLKLRNEVFNYKAIINLNGVETTETSVSSYLNLLSSLCISSNSSNNNALPISFKVSLIGLSCRHYSSSEMDEISDAYDKYFLNSSANAIKTQSLSYFNNKNFTSFDRISLNGEANSKNGLKPIDGIYSRIAFDAENENIYKYDRSILRLVYASFFEDGLSPLTYNLPLATSGTISLFFKTDASALSKRYIVSFYLADSEKFSIYLDSLNNLKVNNNGVTVNVASNVSNNEYHHIYLFYNNSTGFIYFDGAQVSIGSLDLSNCVFYLGSDKTKTFPLDGYIEDLLFSPSLISYDSGVSSYSRAVTIGNCFDVHNRLVEKDLVIKNNKFLTAYVYTSTQLSSETILGSETKIYYYDDPIGNITGVSSTSGVNESYTYDKLSRLLSHTHTVENVEDYIETFTYDSNGNILTRTGRNQLSLTYEYSGDRLTAVKSGGVTIRSITYDSNNVFYPSSMTILGSSKSLTWSGRRLTNIGNDIEYRYNDEGIRIYKSTPLEETTFELEGSNIVVLNKTVNNATYNFAFHYDINGLLASLTYNNKEYFYIRDILGNILGIINDNGEYIIKYDYTAYGEVTKNIIALSWDDLIVATHNPFVYKGYYYDDETGFYYLKSRYYDPTLCRFISIDDFSYLDSKNLTKTNLYAYCGNNPIMYCDPSGCGFITALIFGIVVGVIVGGTVNLVTQLLKNGGAWDKIDWLSFVGSIITGAAYGAASILGGAAGLVAAGGTIGGFSITTGVSVAIACSVSSIANMISYSIKSIANDNFDIFKMLCYGVQGAVQGLISFEIAFLGGYHGLYLRKFKTGIELFSFTEAKISYFYAMPAVLFGETIARALLVSVPSAILRHIFSYLIPLEDF